MKKRVLACVVAAFMLTTLIPTISFADAPVPWNGTYDYSWYSDGPTEFTIYTAEQLAGVMAIQNGIAQNAGSWNSSSLVGKKIILGADIVLNENLTWDANGVVQGTPLPWTSMTSFSGELDGNGHTISGLYVDHRLTTDGYYFGLFALLWRGTVRNLNITDSYLYVQDWKMGGFVSGRSQGGIIDNCNVTNSYAMGNNAPVAGITGENTTPHEGEATIAYITNCNVSNVTLYSTNSGLAGIAGDNDNGCFIKNCTSSVTMSVKGYSGGITGSNYANIDNCSSTGSIVAATAGDWISACGGITGRNTKNGTIGSITNCYSYNYSIDGQSWEGFGGIAGMADQQSSIQNCYSVNSSFHNIPNVAGIVGNFSGAILDNCYSNNTVTSDWNSNSGIASGNTGTATNCFYKTDAVVPLFRDTTNIVVTNCDTYNESYQLTSGGSLVDTLNAWSSANGSAYKSWAIGTSGYPEFGTATEPPANPAVAIDATTVTVSNAPADCVLIIASYDGTKLVDAKSISNPSGNYAIADQISLVNVTNMKAFLWDNLSDITPICDSGSYTVLN